MDPDPTALLSKRGSLDIQSVKVAISEPTLRIAVTHLVQECGLMSVQHDSADIIVSDTSDSQDGFIHVLTVGPSSLAAALALGAVFLGEASAILSTEAPEVLPKVIEMLGTQVGAIPNCVVDNGRQLLALRLSQRQHGLLGVLAAGYAKDVHVARRLGVSLATLKRDVRLLVERTSVSSRYELADLARSLGYSRPLRDAELRLLTPFASTGDVGSCD